MPLFTVKHTNLFFLVFFSATYANINIQKNMDFSCQYAGYSKRYHQSFFEDIYHGMDGALTMIH